MNWIDQKIDEYYGWLRENTVAEFNTGTDWIRISTPFIGQFNDGIDIYVKKTDNTIEMTDDGITIANLSFSGIDILRSNQRKKYIDYILCNYGITLTSNNELYIKSDINNFANTKHMLISAIREISDMEVLAKSNVSSIFKEDVKKYLKAKDVILTPDFIVRGSTGISFTFDYQIAGKTTELVIKPLNTLNKDSVVSFLFSWEDIKDARERVSCKTLNSLAIINDIDNIAKPEYVEALKSKNANVMLWSEKNSELSNRYFMNIA